jgi:geranylgeranyl diphosphate synthase type II
MSARSGYASRQLNGRQQVTDTLKQVRQYIHDHVMKTYPVDPIRGVLADRLTIENRFWPSELFLRVAWTFVGTFEQFYLAVCAAIEYFHIYTLIHDDIIDRHEARWNKPSIVSIAGPGEALLCGDWLFSESVRILATLPAMAHQAGALVQILATGAVSVAEGQLADAACCSASSIDLDQYVRIAQLKTSVGGVATAIGAALCQADTNDQDLIRTFSVNAGISSQIANDVSEIFAIRGFRVPYRQPRGENELRLGRKTIFHVATNGSDASQFLARALLDRISISDLRNWLISVGAAAFAEQTYLRFVDRAKAPLKSLSNDPYLLEEYLKTANPLRME